MHAFLNTYGLYLYVDIVYAYMEPPSWAPLQAHNGTLQATIHEGKQRIIRTNIILKPKNAIEGRQTHAESENSVLVAGLIVSKLA